MKNLLLILFLFIGGFILAQPNTTCYDQSCSFIQNGHFECGADVCTTCSSYQPGDVGDPISPVLTKVDHWYRTNAGSPDYFRRFDDPIFCPGTVCDNFDVSVPDFQLALVSGAQYDFQIESYSGGSPNDRYIGMVAGFVGMEYRAEGVYTQVNADLTAGVTYKLAFRMAGLILEAGFDNNPIKAFKIGLTNQQPIGGEGTHAPQQILSSDLNIVSSQIGDNETTFLPNLSGEWVKYELEFTVTPEVAGQSYLFFQVDSPDFMDIMDYSYFLLDEVCLVKSDSDALDLDLDAGFTFQAQDCNSPIQFLSDEVIGDHFWDFGDGNTSTEVNPIHTYEMPGTYEVMHSIRTCCEIFSHTEILVLECSDGGCSMSTCEVICNDGQFGDNGICTLPCDQGVPIGNCPLFPGWDEAFPTPGNTLLFDECVGENGFPSPMTPGDGYIALINPADGSPQGNITTPVNIVPGNESVLSFYTYVESNAPNPLIVGLGQSSELPMPPPFSTFQQIGEALDLGDDPVGVWTHQIICFEGGVGLNRLIFYLNTATQSQVYIDDVNIYENLHQTSPVIEAFCQTEVTLGPEATCFPPNTEFSWTFIDEGGVSVALPETGPQITVIADVASTYELSITISDVPSSCYSSEHSFVVVPIGCSENLPCNMVPNPDFYNISSCGFCSELSSCNVPFWEEVFNSPSPILFDNPTGGEDCAFATQPDYPLSGGGHVTFFQGQPGLIGTILSTPVVHGNNYTLQYVFNSGNALVTRAHIILYNEDNAPNIGMTANDIVTNPDYQVISNQLGIATGSEWVRIAECFKANGDFDHIGILVETTSGTLAIDDIELYPDFFQGQNTFTACEPFTLFGEYCAIPNTSYEWYDAEGNLLSTIPTLDVPAGPSTKYTLLITVNAQGGDCITRTLVFYVNRPEALIQFSPYCGMESVVLNASGSILPPGYHYIWSTGETSPTIEVTDPGTYSVSITNGTNECFSSAAVDVDLFGEIINVTQLICNGPPQSITPITTPNVTNIYSWFASDGTPLTGTGVGGHDFETNQEGAFILEDYNPIDGTCTTYKINVIRNNPITNFNVYVHCYQPDSDYHLDIGDVDNANITWILNGNPIISDVPYDDASTIVFSEYSNLLNYTECQEICNSIITYDPSFCNGPCNNPVEDLVAIITTSGGCEITYNLNVRLYNDRKCENWRIGNQDMEQELSYSIAPNPTGDHTRVIFEAASDLEHITLEVFDLLGQEVNVPITGKSGNEYRSIDMTTLESGLYILRVSDEQGVISSKTIIKR